MFSSKSAFFVILVAFAGDASAGVIGKRQTNTDDLTVGICKSVGLRSGPDGGCMSITTSNGGCYADFTLLTNDGGSWDNNVSSAAAWSSESTAEGGSEFTCTLYEDPSCSGRQLILTGKEPDLKPLYFDKVASSVSCSYVSF